MSCNYVCRYVRKIPKVTITKFLCSYVVIYNKVYKMTICIIVKLSCYVFSCKKIGILRKKMKSK